VYTVFAYVGFISNMFSSTSPQNKGFIMFTPYFQIPGLENSTEVLKSQALPYLLLSPNHRSLLYILTSSDPRHRCFYTRPQTTRIGTSSHILR